jgi:hypothetical protein
MVLIVEFALQSQLPSIHGGREFVLAGGLCKLTICSGAQPDMLTKSSKVKGQVICLLSSLLSLNW